MERVTELPSLPERPAESHKGTYGRVLLIAGGRGMSGAAALAGLGALRGGAGVVHLAVPNSIAAIVASIEPGYLLEILPEDEQGLLDVTPQDKPLLTALAGKDAIGIGPGIGSGKSTGRLVAHLYRTIAEPLVLDADALNALVGSSQRIPHQGGPRILTPHPGEFARLIGRSIKTVQMDRENLAIDFARRQGVTLLLKGHQTVITDGHRIAINGTGNSGMATGGSGDVLTGLITALLGQRMPLFEAAQLGAHLHGLAGDLAAAAHSPQAMIASDLPKFFGEAWRRLAS